MSVGASRDPRFALTASDRSEVVRRTQMRNNIRHSTEVIRVIDKRSDWQALREAGHCVNFSSGPG